MMRSLITIFFLFITASIFSQKINGIVKDEKGLPLFGVNVINQSSKVGATTDRLGRFVISAESKEILKFSFIGKKNVFYTVKGSDTLNINIQMKSDLTQLTPFVVDGERIKKVSVKTMDNILDYHSIGENTLLILKKSKNYYQLTIEGIDTIYKTFEISSFKPKSIFQDVFGNLHLICKDSIRQIYIDSLLFVPYTISRSDFEGIIKRLLLVSDSIAYKYAFFNYNKKYQIRNTYNDVLYEAYDQKSEEFITAFLNQKPMTTLRKNVSLLRIPRDQFGYRTLYLQVLNRDLQVQTFAVNNLLITFNLYNDTLIVHKTPSKVIFKKGLKSLVNKSTKKIILDKVNNEFYAYSIKNGIVTLDKIDLQSGTSIESYKLSGISFPENLKIIDGWAYYLKSNKKGIHGLYRFSLR